MCLTSKAAAEGGDGAAAPEGVDKTFPAFETWPVFLTRDGKCVRAKDLLWPEEGSWVLQGVLATERVTLQNIVLLFVHCIENKSCLGVLVVIRASSL